MKIGNIYPLGKNLPSYPGTVAKGSLHLTDAYKGSEDIPFGMPMHLDTTGTIPKWRLITTGDTEDKVTAISVREIKTYTNYLEQDGTPLYPANTDATGMVWGSIAVEVVENSANVSAGSQVYVRLSDGAIVGDAGADIIALPKTFAIFKSKANDNVAMVTILSRRF